MHPETLIEHIRKCRNATKNPFGVNVPLMYPDLEKIIKIIVDEGVRIVFTSAGNPAIYTSYLKEKGIVVVHVVANTKFAKKCNDAGVDAIVAEGFEAGGHNGREETTTLALVPHVRSVTGLPLIAAGGIGSGRAMLAAFALGAEGVQVGSRFAATIESSANIDFKKKIIDAKEGDTVLTLKKLAPVRLLRNKFFEEISKAQASGASTNELLQLLGKGRARLGMFEGNLEDGELEIGQVSAMINEILPAARVVNDIVNEFNDIKAKLCTSGNL
jgi:enoyl-[acyl-carrier protein] reductase II